MAGRPFVQVIELALQQFSPEEAKKRHIRIARNVLANYLASQSVKPQVTIQVDHHPASSEDQVQPYGLISYRFARSFEIAQYALDQARALSPVESGRFKASWFCMVDMIEVAPTDIPANKTIMITNDQPYLRKIHQGSKGFERYVPPGIVEKVRLQVLKRYKKIVTAEVQFITLQGGYVMKREHKRADRTKGMPMTYPTLVVTPIGFV